jgi:putative DNA primase/helicase
MNNVAEMQKETINEYIKWKKDKNGNWIAEVKTYPLAQTIIDSVNIINDIHVQAYFNKIWQFDFKSFVKREIHIRLKEHSTAHYERETLNHIENMTYRQYNQTFKFDISHPHIVTFQNGTYNMKTNKIEKHDPQHYSTVLIPHDFTIKKYEAPEKTIDFLRQMLSCDDEIRFIFEWIGYCFYKRVDIHAFLLLVGKGKNGKSTLIRLITELLGEENVSTVPLRKIQENRFASAQLERKLLNAAADIQTGFFEDVDELKAITGGDTIFTEKKGQDGRMLNIFAKLMFSCNELPRFKEQTDAIQERSIILTMSKNPSWDIGIHDILSDKNEMQRIILHSLRVFHRKLETQDIAKRCMFFTHSSNMIEDKKKWLMDGNNIVEFVEECCNLQSNMKTNGTIKVISKNLYDAYKQYCFEYGYRAKNKKNFDKEIETLYKLEKKKSSSEGGKACMFGIKLKEN